MITTNLPAEGCSHEFAYVGRAETAHPRCQRPNLLRCSLCGEARVKRCRSSNVKACEPCGTLYRHNVRRVAASGWAGSPGLGTALVLTLTAPGSQVHYLPSGAACPCTTEENKLDDEQAIAVWNGQAVHNWGRFREHLEETFGAKIAYFRAVEVQERGALHFHVMIRWERPVFLGRNPNARLRPLAIHHGFGHSVEVDVKQLASEAAALAAAGYCSKYVSKTAGEREAAPYCHRRTGEVGPGRWRAWTASRTWGVTMRAVREAQAMWAADPSASEAARVAATGRAKLGPLDPRGLCSGSDLLLCSFPGSDLLV